MLIGQLTTQDLDLNDGHQYTLVEGEGGIDNVSFETDGASLFKRDGITFDFEAKSIYQVRLKTDGFEGSFVQNVTISVEDINELPSSIVVSNFECIENSVVSSLIGVFTSTDVDTDDSYSYLHFAGSGDTGNASF
jgi:hypothetical protein